MANKFHFENNAQYILKIFSLLIFLLDILNNDKHQITLYSLSTESVSQCH